MQLSKALMLLRHTHLRERFVQFKSFFKLMEYAILNLAFLGLKSTSTVYQLEELVLVFI